jgi:hypothetical protein
MLQAMGCHDRHTDNMAPGEAAAAAEIHHDLLLILDWI